MKIFYSSDMNFNLPYFSKIKLPSRIKTRKIPRKLGRRVATVKRQTPLEEGFSDTTSALNKWTSQPNPPKVYLFGKRIHHGLFYGIIGLVGWYYDIPYFKGASLAGTLHDIGDIDHWLDFEPGGNPNSLISFDQSTQTV